MARPRRNDDDTQENGRGGSSASAGGDGDSTQKKAQAGTESNGNATPLQVGPLRAYAGEKLWVAWQIEKRADGSPTKPPLHVREQRKAKSDDPTTWGTLDEARQKAATLTQGGVGIMFATLPTGDQLGGVDLDSCRDPATGAMEPWAQAIVDRLASYTEVSPSKTGVKVFFRHRATDLRNGTFTRGKGVHPPAIEVYLRDRFFTVTGQSVNGIETLREVPAADLRWLIEETGPAFKGKAKDKSKQPLPLRGQRPLSIGDLTRAYAVMANDDLSGDEWIARGIALKGQPGDDGEKFAIFDAFSQRSAKYNASITAERWRKFKPTGKLGTGSIVHWAREADPDWQPTGRVNIAFDPTDPKRMAREAESLLEPTALYQRTGKLVRVIKLGEKSVIQAVHRPAGAIILQEANAVWLSGEFMAAARWLKRNARTGELEATKLPRDVAETYLEMRGEWQVPELVGTVETPTLYKQGNAYRLLQKPGYDAASGLYYVPSISFPKITERASRQDAEVALATLLSLLVEFPFLPDDAGDDWRPAEEPGAVASANRSVALSAVLTGLIRRHMAAAPMHIIDAADAGTGKSYLVKVLSMILIGREPGAVTWVADEAESRKRILAMLLAGDPVIRFDNVDQPLGGPALAVLLTEGNYSERMLGRSIMVNAPTNCLVLATGNNVQVAANSTRRAVRCRMEAREERPEGRTFVGNPLAEAAERRGELVAAGLTILLGYLQAGCPGWNKLPPVGSFEDWSLVRGALVWLGQPDPEATMASISADDPERELLGQMMMAWQALYEGRGAVRLTEVFNDARQGEDKYTCNDAKLRDLYDAISAALKNKRLTAIQMGYWFKTNEGKIVDGQRFVRSGTNKHGHWITLLTSGKADLVKEAEG